MRILLTGASGFVGRHTLTSLIRLEHDVVALSRSSDSDALIESLGARVVRGNLSNIDAWADAVNGIDAVIHAAAPVELWGEWTLFDEQIVKATDQLARTAAKAGVKRFIHISSESALQDKGKLLDIDETYPYPNQPNSLYGRAKKQAEIALMAWQTDMTVIILRPPFIWGDDSPGVAQVLEAAASGKFMWLDKGASAFEAIHVQNLVHGIVCALGRGDSGIYWLTDGKDYSVKSFFGPLLQQKGIALPKLSMPSGLVNLLARGMECLWSVLGLKSKPPLTRFEAALLGQPRRYRIERARTALSYQPTTAHPIA